MKLFFYYVPRAISTIIVIFLALFVLEGFSPEFGVGSALGHLVLAIIALIVTILAWKRPLMGGTVFILMGLWLLLSTYMAGFSLGGLVAPSALLLTGVLFLAQGLQR